MDKETIHASLSLLLIVVLFISFSYLLHANAAYFEELVRENNLLSIVSYISLLIIAVVIAPVSFLPLIVVASHTWGWFYAGLFSIVGWSVGAAIAFVIARFFGAPAVKQFISLQKIEAFEKKIPRKNMFWSIIVLRLLIPVDILSYALGLFSTVSFETYMLASIIGITPFAFIFAYIGTIAWYYQIFALLVIALFLGIGYWIYFRRNKK